jgi:serine/threonine-protein kinase
MDERRPDDDLEATVALGASGVPGPPVPATPPEPLVAEGGRFRVVRQLARGGIGRIFVALDAELSREVALKEILPEHAEDRSSQARFLLEAEVTGALEHPGIVPVYALGRHPDGRPYYAMRLIRGQSLLERIREIHGPANDQRTDGRPQRLVDAAQDDAHPPRPQAPHGRRRFDPATLRPLLRRLIDASNALEYAHSRGIVHRDIKPANIMLGPYGETLIVDWGLAKLVSPPDRPLAPADDRPESGPSDDAALTPEATPWRPASGSGTAETLPGRAVGTPAYMSPEQASGDPDGVGPASDVFSLGATLYHLVTGHGPFEGLGIESLLSHRRHRHLRAPRQLDPSVPRALEAICLKALAPRPEDRYPSVRALADDLDRFLADEPVSAHREPPSARLARWFRRHRAWSLAGLATMVALVALAGLAAEVFRRSAVRERAAREQGLVVAARFAARSIAAEIDRRWRILETEAEDDEFVEVFRAAQGHPSGTPGRDALQHWIERRFTEHEAAAPSASWSVYDRGGTQLARAPYEGRSIGTDYSYRDYFHGQGRDLEPGTPGLSPIDRPHRSIVFRSRASGKLMVSFSVPIRRDPEGEGPEAAQVVGVLAMSVEVGQFATLDLDLGSDQVAVLADLHPDARGQPGLLLHHPHLAGQAADPPIVYLPADELAPLDRVHIRFLEHHRHRGNDGAREPSPSALLVRGYADPVGRLAPEFGGTWLAAFEPVVVENRPPPVDDTGWVVIVQEHEQATAR